MRRIFSGKNSGNNDPPPKPLMKKTASTDATSSRRDSINKQHRQQQTTQKREHWCPTCPSEITTERCDTPPSGDENISTSSPDADSTVKKESISQTRHGLPEECQDKQVLRPSIINSSISPTPSPEPFEWTSGLQSALDQLVIESRQELRRKYVSEPPSPSSSPPLLEKRSHGNEDKLNSSSRPGMSTSTDYDEVSSSRGEPRLSHPINLEEEDDEEISLSHSMDFESSTSFCPSANLTRSLSRSSNDGPSILSNPRSHSFSDWSRGGGRSSDNFSCQEVSTDSSRDRSHSKYLSARAVAERLAKAIRGNSKPKRLPPIPQTSTRSSESIASHSTNKIVKGAITHGSNESRVSSHQAFSSNKSRLGVPKVQIEKRRVDVERTKVVEPSQHKQENDFFRRQLESHSAQICFVYDSLSERVHSAEGLLAAMEAELKSGNADKTVGRLSSRELERHDALHRRLKKLQKERNELAREVVSEVRLRNMERTTVREVVEFMKKDMEFWIKSLERDKLEIQRRMEEVEKKGNNVWLKKVAEEKSWLEKELVVVTSKESALRQKVREFEVQMQAHVARVEDAERTILELRESVVTGQKKVLQMQEANQQLNKAYKEKESENMDLKKLVGRLQQLCADHEKSIRGLWQSLRCLSHNRSDQKVQQELLRLSDEEQTLRRELEASRAEMDALKHDLTANKPFIEDDHLKEKVNLLSKRLQESLDQQKKQQKEISDLESEKRSLKKKNEDLLKMVHKDSQMEDNNEEQGGKRQMIDGLQQSLSDMTHALNTQNSRIQRLTGRNEELLRLFTAKEKELLDFQTKTKRDSENRKAREDELTQVKESVKYLETELQVQQLHCNVLREKVANKEMEVEECRSEMADGSKSRAMLQEEVSRLQRHLDNATDRVSELEHQLKDREQKLGMVHGEMKKCLQEVGRYKEEMPKVIRQRDEMKEEAEELGREALRMSAEAEVLRRRVHELEEEVMLRDGHLSILRGSLNNAEDDC